MDLGRKKKELTARQQLIDPYSFKETLLITN